MPGELHLLRPDRVTVPTDASGWPTGLEYREGGTRRRIGLGPSAPSTGSLSISPGGGALHLTFFHPIDDHYGFPPLEAALIALDTHNAAGRGNKALFDNSARPSGALVFAPKEGGTLSDEQFDRRKSGNGRGLFRRHARGPAAAARRRARLKGDEPDAEGHGFHRGEELRQARHRTGLRRAADAARHSGRQHLCQLPGGQPRLLPATILPLIARTAKEFRPGCRWCSARNLRLWFDADQIEGIAAERDALWARVGAASFLSDDEKRQAVGYGGVSSE